MASISRRTYLNDKMFSFRTSPVWANIKRTITIPKLTVRFLMNVTTTQFQGTTEYRKFHYSIRTWLFCVLSGYNGTVSFCARACANACICYESALSSVACMNTHSRKMSPNVHRVSYKILVDPEVWIWVTLTGLTRLLLHQSLWLTVRHEKLVATKYAENYVKNLGLQ